MLNITNTCVTTINYYQLTSIETKVFGAFALLWRSYVHFITS